MTLPGLPVAAGAATVSYLVAVANGSDEIISNVKATVVSGSGADVGAAALEWTDIGPGQKVEITQNEPDNGRIRDPLRLKLAFTDSAGRR